MLQDVILSQRNKFDDALHSNNYAQTQKEHLFKKKHCENEENAVFLGGDG